MKKCVWGILAGFFVTAIVIAVILIVPKCKQFVPNLELYARDMEMFVDDSPQMLTYTVECNEEYSVEFVVNSNLVSVDEYGYVTAKYVGSCTIEINVISTSLRKSICISVVVKKRENTFVPTLELTVQNATLSLYNDDAPTEIQYSICCNEKYTVEFVASLDIVSVDKSGKITPNKVGTCGVLVTAKSVSGLKQEKEIVVTVNKSQIMADIEIKNIDGSIPQNIFMSKQYMLEISCTKNLIYSPIVKASENISNLTLKDRQEQKMLYTFKVANYGETSFTFSYKDYTKTFTKQAYMYVSKIDTSFSRKIENMQIFLYLFNKNCENTANLSNFYQNIQFSILEQDNVINNYSVEVVGDNVTLEYSTNTYTILAKTAGESQITIYANDSSGYFVTYTIIVQEVHISSISFTQDNVSLDIDEIYTYNIDYSPIFALTNLTYFLNGEPYTSATLQFSSAGTNILKVLDTLSNLEATVTFTVTQKENPFTIMWDTNFMNTHTASFENDTLSVTTTEDTIDIPFSYEIQGVTSIKCDISYTLDGIILSNHIFEDNTITLTLQGKGSITLTLTSQENPSLSYTLTIVVF